MQTCLIWLASQAGCQTTTDPKTEILHNIPDGVSVFFIFLCPPQAFGVPKYWAYFVFGNFLAS
jgi:hypothetical protein